MKAERRVILHGTLEDDSRDFKMILDMRKQAEELACMARRCNEKNFDVADDLAKEGEMTLIVSCNTKEAEAKAEKLIKLLEGVEKEAREFYKTIGIKAKGPMGETIEPIIRD